MAPILDTFESIAQSLIEGMTTGGGYNFNWGTVNNPDLAQVIFPTAWIFIEAERNIDVIDGAGAQSYRNEVDVRIEVMGEIATETAIPNWSINSIHNKALDDLKKLFGITANIHVGNSIDVMMYQGMTREDPLPTSGDRFHPGKMITTWLARYYQSRTDPETHA